MTAVEEYRLECKRHVEQQKLRHNASDDFVRGVHQGFVFIQRRADAAIAELEAELELWRSRYGYGIVFKTGEDFKRHIEQNGGYCLVCHQWTDDLHVHHEVTK